MKLGWILLVFLFFASLVLPPAVIAGPTPGGADADSDGVENAFDNCTSRANPSQKDTDHDGCGDLCDGDYDQNGGAGLTDYGLFLIAFGSTTGQPNYRPVCDIDCNGTIGISDYGLFLTVNHHPVGPSGITNASRNPTACPF